MTKTAEEQAGDLSADLAALRRDVAQLTSTMGKLVSGKAHAASDSLTGAMGEAGDTLAGQASRVAAHVGAASGEIESYVARNPLAAALVAFGVGLTLGLVSRPKG